jgi:site-specific DNA-methyltransferase (adenine-specific)
MHRNNERNIIYQGDSLSILKTLPDEFVDCIMTSPPYFGLRDYGIEGQLGLEPSFQEFISKLCDVFDEAKRVLKKDGTCFVNLGDTYGTRSGRQNQMLKGASAEDTSYGGIPIEFPAVRQDIKGKDSHKCLLQIPSRFAIEMVNRGWILRNEIIWSKPNVMPSSADDRFTVDFEKLFFFVKNKDYYFEQQLEPLKEISLKRAEYGWDCDRANNQAGIHTEKMGDRFVNPLGRNKRCVWEIVTSSFSEAHFATYPEELCETPIKAGSPKGGIVLDPFFGSGTTGAVAKKLGRDYIGIELNPEYIKIAEKRLKDVII